jgi:hypothetical protein
MLLLPLYAIPEAAQQRRSTRQWDAQLVYESKNPRVDEFLVWNSGGRF